MTALEDLFGGGTPYTPEEEDIQTNLGFFDQIAKDWEDIKAEPVRAAPLALETLGGIAGATIPIPLAGPMVGAMAGRFAGEWLESWKRGTPLFDAQNVYEMFRAPLQQIPLGLGVGFVKGLAKGNLTAELMRGSEQGLIESLTGKRPIDLVKTIVSRAPVTKAGEPGVEEAFAEAGKLAFLRRTAMYWDDPGTKMEEISANAAAEIRNLTEPRTPYDHTRLYQRTKDEDWYNLQPTKTMEEGVKHAQHYIDVPNTELTDYMAGLTGTKLTQPVTNKQGDFLFPSKAKGYETQTWHLPTRTQEQITEAAHKEIQGHIATRMAFRDEVAALTKAQQDLPSADMERILDIKRMGDLAPELIDSPMAKAFQRIGILPSLFGAQRVLRKSGNPLLTGIADVSLLGQETQQSLTHHFTKISNDLFEKYKITEDDYAKFLFLRHHPDMTEQIVELIRGGMTPDEAATQGLTTLFQTSKVPLNVTKEDLPRLQNLLAFMGERKTAVTDPLMALGVAVNPDPKRLALRDPNFMFSSSISGREYETITDNIARLTQSYDKMSAAQQAGPMGVRLQKAIQLETYRQGIASEAWDKTNQAMTQAKIDWEEHGRLPTTVNFGGFKAKETNLPFGPNFVQNESDWIRSNVRKIVLDETLPIMHGLAGGLEDPHAMEYVSKFILDQSGQRRNMQVLSMANSLKESPYLPKKAKEWLGDPANLNKTIDSLNTYTYLFHIALNPRFYVMNFTQPFLTLRPLVGDEAFSHGLAEVVGNGRALYARALEAGAVNPDMAKYVGEGPVSMTGNKLLRAIGKPAEYSETLNRLWAYAAGEHVANAEGKYGAALAMRAADISRDANFGYGQAEKALITNTPIGSMAFRFRSFTAGYGSFLANQAKNNPKAFAESLASLVSLAGTTGIPAYGLIRQMVANYGVVLPEIEPLHQMTGLDMGQSVSPLFEFPQEATQVAGPVIGPVVGGMVQAGKLAAGRGEEVEAGYGLASLLGAPGKMIAAGAEALRGGETRTPTSRELIARRSPAEMLKYAAGFAPAPRVAASKGERELELGVAAKDPQAIQRAMQNLRDEGIVNPGKKLSMARAKIKRQKNVSVVGTMLGI